jgi:hypothetical protein
MNRIIIIIIIIHCSWDRPTSIVMGYRLDNHGSRVQFPAGQKNRSHLHSIQTGSGVHPASHKINTEVLSPERRVAIALRDHYPSFGAMVLN